MAAQQTKTQTNLPPVRLEPGWYWWHYIRSETEAQWAAFHALSLRTLKIRKTFPGDTSRANVVVFEVLEPIAWTLSGIPSKAPKKGRTELKDLATAPEFKAAPDLAALLAEAGEVGSSASTVGKVLLWGGAAVLLLNLWRWSEPPQRRYALEED